MIRKHKDYRWDDVSQLVYKEDNSPFRSVTRQVLFDGAEDIPCQWRYFEVAPGGYSTLEHHQHTHWVMIFRGKGMALLGDEVQAVSFGDLITIPAWQWHQFRANRGEALGFLCLVNQERDKVTLPTDAELTAMKKNPAIRDFLEEP